MSADNGIYIGEFPDGFRVVVASAIDNLEYHPEGSLERSQVANNYFGNCVVFESMDAAYKFACALEDTFGPTEYGICIIRGLTLEEN